MCYISVKKRSFLSSKQNNQRPELEGLQHHALAPNVQFQTQIGGASTSPTAESNVSSLPQG
jgi:hypothetical protein